MRLYLKNSLKRFFGNLLSQINDFFCPGPVAAARSHNFSAAPTHGALRSAGAAAAEAKWPKLPPQLWDTVQIPLSAIPPVFQLLHPYSNLIKVNFCTGTGRKAFFEFFFGLILDPPRYICFYSEKMQIHLYRPFSMAWPF